jgi:DNA-binding NtrC family response regulator
VQEQSNRKFGSQGWVMGVEKRVLIVDDEPANANTLRMIFSMAGYSARAAYSAEEALPAIAEWHPHLVILDVRLPGMNGIDLAMKMKTDYPRTNVLLCSGDGSIAGLLESARKQGHEFPILAKPVPPPEFLKVAADFFPPSETIEPGVA